VFASPAALQKLESIVHPAVRALTKDLLRANRKPVVVVEAIKLVEAGMHQWCDTLWAVDCTPGVQIERVLRTRNMSQADARARLAAQGSFEEKSRLATIVIDNSGDQNATRAQVEKAWRAIHPETARDKREWLLGLSGAQAEPAPPIQVDEETTPAAPKELLVRRSRRIDLEALGIALAKKENRAEPLSREETLKRFGVSGYRIALVDKQIVALAAWEAENLIASVREVWAESAEDAAQALPRLFELIENEARELLCEVVWLMLPASAPAYIAAQAQAAGYVPLGFDALHPLWQQAIQERMQTGDQLWGKPLREKAITRAF
jgi:dephospho-CoA kinase